MSLSNLARSVSTVLREVFAAPASGSYVFQNDEKPLVIRQGGHYPEIDLTGYNLSGFDLHDTDLRGAKLQNANLTDTDLSGANLTAADLTGAIVTNTKFDNAVIEDADFTGWKFEIPPSGLASVHSMVSAN